MDLFCVSFVIVVANGLRYILLVRCTQSVLVVFSVYPYRLLKLSHLLELSLCLDEDWSTAVEISALMMFLKSSLFGK